jgi:hypothetical protein
MYCPEMYLKEMYEPEMCNQVCEDEPCTTAAIPNPESHPLLEFLGSPSVTNLFVILVGIGTMISLLPIFLDFFIGSNWLAVFLKDWYGFITLLLMITAVFLGVFFMMIILVYIAYEFYKQVIMKNYSRMEKIISAFYLMCGFLSFFSLLLVLLSVWIIKAMAPYNFILLLSLFFISVIIGSFFLISGEIVFFDSISQNDIENFKKVLKGFVSKIKNNLLKIIIALVLICIIGYLIFLVISPPVSLISNYYNDTSKKIGVKIGYNESIAHNGTPLLLPLHYSLENVTQISIDLYYIDCHWSTNYGHFIEISPDYSQIINHQQEVEISNCPFSMNNVFWTYDNSEYGVNKSEVFIGFTIKDINKDKILGTDHLNLTWKERDVVEIENKS